MGDRETVGVYLYPTQQVAYQPEAIVPLRVAMVSWAQCTHDAVIRGKIVG